MSILEHVGSKIRELRNGYNGGSGLSQEDLARKIEVSTNTVSRWETCTYKPSIEDLEKLARYFGVSILEFFPTEQKQEQEDSRIMALLRAAKELPPEDIEELQRYAEFRKARMLLGHQARPQPGRKRKGEV
jgi:transcriptional regulator with XRE-family HTH domain